MSERFFRLIQGIYLLTALYFHLDVMIYIFMGVFIFEAVTNWRIPILVSQMRYGNQITAGATAEMSTMQIQTHYSFEAERMLRITVTFLLMFSFVIYREPLWFVPWFVSMMLLSAGITNICPMVMFYRYLGFR